MLTRLNLELNLLKCRRQIIYTKPNGEKKEKKNFKLNKNVWFA